MPGKSSSRGVDDERIIRRQEAAVAVDRVPPSAHGAGPGGDVRVVARRQIQHRPTGERRGVGHVRTEAAATGIAHTTRPRAPALPSAARQCARRSIAAPLDQFREEQRDDRGQAQIATIQNRAGTRSPSPPGTSMTHVYGPSYPIDRSMTRSRGPSDSSHISTHREQIEAQRRNPSGGKSRPRGRASAISVENMLTSTGLATVDADMCSGPDSNIHAPNHQTLSAIAAYTMATPKGTRTAMRIGRGAGADRGPDFRMLTAAATTRSRTRQRRETARLPAGTRREPSPRTPAPAGAQHARRCPR